MYIVKFFDILLNIVKNFKKKLNGGFRYPLVANIIVVDYDIFEFRMFAFDFI